MKTLNKVILPILLVLLAACSKSYDMPDDITDAPIAAEPGLPSGPIELGVLISVDDATADNGYGRTRGGFAAPANGDYHPGTGFEDFIDIASGDFALYIFSLDNKLISHAGITSFLPAEPGTLQSSKKYVCRFRLDNPEDIVVDMTTRKASFKLVMLANWRAWSLTTGAWGDYPALSAGEDIDALYNDAASTRAYTGSVGPAITKETRIPLFGIGSYENIDLSTSPDIPTDLSETIHLLRAFAKVEVRPAEGSLVDIKTVTLTRANTLFKALPSEVYDRGGYITGSHATDYVSHVSVPGTTEVLTNLTFPKTTNEDNEDSWIIYVPEYDNLTNPDTKSQIEVTYTDNASFLVDFKNYGTLTGIAKDKGFDIRRNNWYVYELKRLSETVSVELDVQPYASCEVSPGLGLLTDELGDLMIYMEEDPKNPGSLKLPDIFKEYLKLYNKELPKAKTEGDTEGEELKYYSKLGDYYAIHRTNDGTMKNAEIWLKDRDGDRVMTNFSDKNANDEYCSTRMVWEYISLIQQNEYHKDTDGDRRMQHNTNHSSLIYSPEKGLLFKIKDANGEKHYYEVESWDSNTGIFYVRGENQTHTEYVFTEYDNSGKPTGVKRRVNKTTGEEIIETEEGEDNQQ